jgi:hypothetical protein
LAPVVKPGSPAGAGRSTASRISHARRPAESGMPELIEDLAPEVDSMTELLLAERERER